jgi:hypothetical protein
MSNLLGKAGYTSPVGLFHIPLDAANPFIKTGCNLTVSPGPLPILVSYDEMLSALDCISAIVL